MKKIFVKWTMNDNYGYARDEFETYTWFDTEEEANAFVAEKKKKNGGYFHLYKVAEGNYAEFERMEALAKELAELKAKF